MAPKHRKARNQRVNSSVHDRERSNLLSLDGFCCGIGLCFAGRSAVSELRRDVIKGRSLLLLLGRLLEGRDLRLMPFSLDTSMRWSLGELTCELLMVETRIRVAK